MLPISEILAKTLQELPSAYRITVQFILDSWPDAVGAYIARKTKAVSVKQGVLLVRVSDPIWAQHLVLQKKQILERLNRGQSTKILKDIRFQIGSFATDARETPARKKTFSWHQENLAPEELAQIDESFKEAGLPAELAQSLQKYFIAQKKLQKWYLKRGIPACEKCGLPMVKTTEKMYCLRCKTEECG